MTRPSKTKSQAYAVFGLEPSASLSEVTRKYHQAMKLCHPDNAGNNDMAQTMAAEYNAAYMDIKNGNFIPESYYDTPPRQQARSYERPVNRQNANSRASGNGYRETRNNAYQSTYKWEYESESVFERKQREAAQKEYEQRVKQFSRRKQTEEIYKGYFKRILDGIGRHSFKREDNGKC